MSTRATDKFELFPVSKNLQIVYLQVLSTVNKIDSVCELSF